MKKLLRGSSVWSFIATSAITYDRTIAKIPISWANSPSSSDLCVEMEIQLTEPLQL